MHVISYKRIREFIKDHPDSAIKLGRWYKWMKKGKFNNLNEIKKKFSGVDYIGNDRYIFNISGNKYRLVAVIFLSTRIGRIFSHRVTSPSSKVRLNRGLSISPFFSRSTPSLKEHQVKYCPKWSR